LSRPSWLRPALLWPVPVVVIAALLVIPRLRGPELPGYRIESRPLVQTVVATGRVISTSRVQVGSEVTGTVRERRVKEGDVVKPGDVLIVLGADDLVAAVREAEAALSQLQVSTRPQAEAALRQADAQAAQAVRERQRRADLFARQLVAREALEQAEEAEAVARAAADSARLAANAAGAGGSVELQLRERLAAARARLAKTTIRAQTRGVVLTRNVEPGDLVQPGRVLLEIARDGDTEIEVPVDEKNLGVLALGQTAQCIADAYPDQPFAAVVNYVAPGIDAQLGTVIIRVKVAPVPDFLRQDMTVSVNVQTGRRDAALAVPNDALLDAGGAEPAVLVVRDGRLSRASVQLGLKGLAMTEVTSGLQAGDLVLAAAASLKDVAPGSRVRVALEGLPAGSADTSSRRELPVKFN
jgi:HlyD family secretion protein